MTDNDIIKALECCTSEIAGCTGCPRFPSLMGCSRQNMRDALDLINRQKAKIKELDEKNVIKLGLIDYQKAEIERLQELVDDMGDYFPGCINCEGKTEIGERTDKCVYLIDNTNYCTKRGIANIAAIQNENRSLKEQLQTARAEAITEFAERLKEKMRDLARYSDGEQDYYLVGYPLIDQIAKEMKEGVKE